MSTVEHLKRRSFVPDDLNHAAESSPRNGAHRVRYGLPRQFYPQLKIESSVRPPPHLDDFEVGCSKRIRSGKQFQL